MILAKMAFRNIFRQRRRSLLTGLMMMGGFVLCSIFFGFSEGSYGNIINLFTRNNTGHVQIHSTGYLDRPSLYKTIDSFEAIERKITGIRHVKSVTPRVSSPALAFVEAKTTGAEVIGIDIVKEPKTTSILDKVGKGRFFSDKFSNEIIIGSGLADILKAGIRDEVALIAQGADGSIANDNFIVIGIISEKTSSSDKMKCYMDIKTAQNFLVLDERIHEIVILLDDQRFSRETASLITEALNNEKLDVEPWQVVEKAFFRVMQVDNIGNYITQGIIILIVAIGVLNTVLMSILERTREFGVIRAIGTRPGKVFFLILLETAFLSLISIFAGIILASGINHYLAVHGIKMPSPVDIGGIKFDTMLSIVSWRTIWIPGITTLSAAILVSVFPGIRAARIKPVNAMRYA